MKKNKWIVMTGLMLSLSAYAQTPKPIDSIPSQLLAEGGHSGNGGGEDAKFKNIRDEIKDWLEKNQAAGKLETKLQLAGVSGQALLDRYEKAVTDVGEKIVFNHDEIKFNENVRICRNDKDKLEVTCNIESWNAADGDLKYIIAFHEFLGIADLEPNIMEYSQYPISAKIGQYVRTTTGYELGMEKRIEKLVILSRPEESIGAHTTIDYSASSDVNGLCKRLGYLRGVPGSLQSDSGKVCTLVIDAAGNVSKQLCAGFHFASFVASVTCLTQ